MPAKPSPTKARLVRGSLLGGLALALLAQPGRATAGLNYDLRINGGKIGYITAIGQTVTLDLYAEITGAVGNSGVEGFQDGYGSILSSAGGNITGSLSSSFVAPFNALGAQPGVPQTLDSDSDLDLGSNLTEHSTDFFFARSGSMTTTGGAIIADGVEFKIATFTFTAQTIANFGNFTPISINFRVPLFSNGIDIEALWQEDGIGTSSNGLNGGTQPTVGPAVMISVPEPSTLGLLALAGAGLARRRRPAVRRQYGRTIA